MKITELKPKQGNVTIELDITEMGEVRTFEKFGKTGKVCNATASDGEGSIKLSLWNDQADQVKVGDKVKIENGYVNEYQGELQLTTGKFGKLEVTGKSDTPATEAPKTNTKVDEESIDES